MDQNRLKLQDSVWLARDLLVASFETGATTDAAEPKVGRTSLTAAARSQIVKDFLLRRNDDVTGMERFSRSGVNGQIGRTGPLAAALGKAGIPWSLAP